MKKNYVFLLMLFAFSLFSAVSCSKSEDDAYVPVSPGQAVRVDLTTVPYQKLSEYQFFKGELRDLDPVDGVLPFEPASSLFSDYALKKRFVWMPAGTRATYNTDGTILELPVGAALIKTFYYDKVQNVSPAGTTRIIETRLMIRKATGWIFANYVWNEAQTEAIYDMGGSVTPVSWKDADNVLRTVDYNIPATEQCMVCHKSSRVVNGVQVIEQIPIGIKPQNLNFSYNYSSGAKNQLSKWIEQGYLADNFTLPTVENTTVDYKDDSKPVDVRARSYVDINCAHCHHDYRHCDYRPMRYAFSETGNNETNMGVCVNTNDMQGFPAELGKIVTPHEIGMSMMFYRMNTTNPNIRMPIHGRTLKHDEGLALIRNWINQLHECE